MYVTYRTFSVVPAGSKNMAHLSFVNSPSALHLKYLCFQFTVTDGTTSLMYHSVADITCSAAVEAWKKGSEKFT